VGQGVPLEVIALILGHEDIATTYAFYFHADLRAAEQAISLVASPNTSPDVIERLTPSSAFLRACDYADPIRPITASDNDLPWPSA
jgi:hypothetical protein